MRKAESVASLQRVMRLVSCERDVVLEWSDRGAGLAPHVPCPKQSAKRCVTWSEHDTRSSASCGDGGSPRSTALDVEGRSLSSKKVKAFSRLGGKRFYKVLPIRRKRRIRRCNRASFSKAVSLRQRRSKRRYTSSLTPRSVRNSGCPRVMRIRVRRWAGVRTCCTNR